LLWCGRAVGSLVVGGSSPGLFAAPCCRGFPVGTGTVCAKMQVLQAGAGFHASPTQGFTGCLPHHLRAGGVSVWPTKHTPARATRSEGQIPLEDRPRLTPFCRAHSTSTIRSGGVPRPREVVWCSSSQGVEASWLISSSLRPHRRKAGVSGGVLLFLTPALFS
jgi:hypothetical protein